MEKRKLEPCNNCGLYGMTTISYVGLWGIFCGSCKRGYASRFLWLAIQEWNNAWRKGNGKAKALKDKQ